METLADYVADALNAKTDWSVGFQATRRTYPLTEADDLAAVTVSTYDGPRLSEQVTRGDWEHTRICFVVLQQAVPPGETVDTSEVNPLLGLLREIEAYFESLTIETNFGGFRYFAFDEGTERLPFNIDVLQSASVYSALVGLEFLE